MHRTPWLAAAMVWSALAAAQATITASGLGTNVQQSGDNYTIDGGTVKGNNLFHSFGAFSVPSFGSAVFDGPPATQNVISRVTGGQLSSIDGLISTRAGASPMPSANFFFINPSGVSFGPNAMLDIGGAVHFSTADRIKLSDGVIFDASATADILTSAPPQAFGFLNANPAPITLDGSQLFVDSGQTLSLIGGGVHVDNGAVLGALGGRVQIVSVGSPGEVVLDAPDLGVGSFSRMGEVTISGGGGVTAGTDEVLPGGTVFIRGGQIVVDGALVVSDTVDSAGAPIGIDIGATGSLILRNGSLIQTSSRGTGDASGISIVAGDLSIDSGTIIQTVGGPTAPSRGGNIDIHAGPISIVDAAIETTGNAGSAGDISIHTSGTLTISGATAEIGTFTNAIDPGTFFLGGDVAVSAANVVLLNQGQIRSGGGGSVEAGNRINIIATDAISISGLAGISTTVFDHTVEGVSITTGRLAMDAGYITTRTLAGANAGRIAVSADSVSLTNGAQIASSSEGAANGAGGSIAVNAGSVTISGVGPSDGVGSVIFTKNPSSGLLASTAGVGNAGQIAVTTAALTLSDGARISTSTSGSGNAGAIATSGGSVAVSGGARMEGSTTGAGAGGAMTISGSSVTLSGAGSGLFSTASSTGGAGQIGVSASSLNVADGARISVATSGAGNAGTILANAATLAVSGGQVDSSTSAAGAGGAISLGGDQVRVVSGGKVTADSTGSGVTGNIAIAATDRIVMTNGSISTRAATSDGGNITLSAPNIIRLDSSQISTSVQSGTGGGGNIFIDPQVVILNNSSITANAFGGPGGNISIVADNYLPSATSIIEASSALSTPGFVQIRSPENNLAQSVAQLPPALLDASRLMREACSARRAGTPSSFVLAGRGGLPPEADGYLPSSLVAAPPVPVALARMDDADCAR